MKQLTTFFHVLKNSFSSVLYYKHVLKAPFSFSLKYFLFFSFLLSLIISVVISVKILIPLNEFLTRFPQVLVRVYPTDLEVKINKGKVTTNVQEPYFIPIERVEETFKEFEKNVQGARTDEIKNILVIDTNATIEDLANYQTYALLTKNYLSYYKEDGRIETISLESVDNITINQSIISGIINKFLPILKYLSLSLIPLVFVGSFMFLTISQLIYLLFSSLVLYLVAKIVAYKLSYSKAYQFDLHIATIIFPFFLLLGALNIHLQFPLLRLIIFTIVGFYIVKTLKRVNLSSSGSKK